MRIRASLTHAHGRKLTVAGDRLSGLGAELASGGLAGVGRRGAVVQLEAGETEFEGSAGAGAGQVGLSLAAVVTNGHDLVHC